MKFKVFPLAAYGDELAEAAVNEFLASHRIIHTDRQIIQAGAASYWSVCIGYDVVAHANQAPGTDKQKRMRVDYKEVLNEQQFREYSALREWRKKISEAENIPVFGVLSNAQLAAITQTQLLTVSDIASIEGIGSTKLDRYGQALFDLLKNRRGDVPNA